MRTEDLPTVRALDLFAAMSDESFADLMQGAFFQRFPPQVMLIEEGDTADFLYVVVEGMVEMIAQGNERETTIAVMEPVSTFILAAVLRDAVYLMSARTLERSRLLMIPAESIREAMERDPAFTRAMVRELAGAFRGVIKSLKSQKLRSAVERLANWLLVAHDDQGANGTVTLGIDKRTLAALLGMTPENLSRAFGTLRGYGIEVAGREIVLSRPDDLRGLAKSNPLIDDRET
ncbi:MAG: cyclic nucleotide-binding domain-containing protein [Alphaproteobacteria bacterium]|nr:cyclic nucleotide-binding domain-containing protein [Alphaproteobacteria bacterium]